MTEPVSKKSQNPDLVFEADPLRAALLDLANRWYANVRPGGGIPSEVRDIHVLLSTIPEPVTHTEYGVYTTPEKGVIETKSRYLALIAIKDNPDAIMVTRKVTAWEPVKEEA